MRSWVAITLLMVTAGCGGSGAAPGDAAPRPQASTVGEAVSHGPDTTCTSPRPKRVTPFVYNHDWERRDELVDLPEPQIGGSTLFQDLDRDELAQLIDEGFIDPHYPFNLAPTPWQIFRFMCRHPEVTAMGYAISQDREDYATWLVTVWSDTIDDALRADAKRFCRDAQTDMAGHLECFWD